MKSSLIHSWNSVFWLTLLSTAYPMAADEPYRPKPGEFPAIEKAKSFRGELVFVDHVNRRGSIRLQVDGHFQEGNLFHFAMLPYGMIRYRGAAAELKDIPLGTVVYGRFFLPPDPKTSVVPLASGKQVTCPAETHAILLEDGPSLCLKGGNSWKLSKVQIQGSSGHLTARIKRTDGRGLDGEHQLTIDGSTRIWRGRELLGIEDLLEEGVWPTNGERALGNRPVQLSLTWHPRYLYQQFHVADLWLDETAIEVARKRQNQKHIRHIKTRWMPARIDKVEHGRFGKAIIRMTLFGGMDSSLYADFKAEISGKIAAAESTLRTWWPDHDGMNGRIISVETASGKPVMGSSGITVTMEVPLVLEGFRPGRTVRVRPNHWPNVKPPYEERVRSLEDRWPSPEKMVR